MTHFAKAALVGLPVLSTTTAFAKVWPSLLLNRTVTIDVPDTFAAGSATIEFLPPG